MDTPFPAPALAAGAPAALQQPVLVPALPRRTLRRISELAPSILYYGLVAFGMIFPVVATIYALIVY